MSYSNPGYTLEDTYLTSSSNDVVSFSTPRCISDASSPTSFLKGNIYEAGHLVASTNGAADVAWTDSRRGNTTNAKTDVFSSRVQLAPRE